MLPWARRPREGCAKEKSAPGSRARSSRRFRARPALPRGAGDRGNPERGAARSRAHGPALRQPAAQHVSSVAAPAPRSPAAVRTAHRGSPGRFVLFFCVGCGQNSVPMCRFGWRWRQPPKLKVISRLRLVSPTKAFYVGLWFFSGGVSALQSAWTVGVTVPFLCFDKLLSNYCAPRVSFVAMLSFR